jgi:hypothetical protein
MKWKSEMLYRGPFDTPNHLLLLKWRHRNYDTSPDVAVIPSSLAGDLQPDKAEQNCLIRPSRVGRRPALYEDDMQYTDSPGPGRLILAIIFRIAE